MKIAVLGATGMIGHHVAQKVVERGHELLVIHRESSNLAPLDHLPCSSRIADLNSRQQLTEALAGADAVINSAGYYPTKPLPWRDEVATASHQMANFLAASTAAQLHKIVYVGGAIALPHHPDGEPGNEYLVYPARPADPTPYVQVKWEMDRQARLAGERGMPVVIGIPAMCFGEHDYGPTTGRLIVDIANGELPGYVRGNRNVIYTGDAALGLVLACERGRNGERYLLANTNVSMDELITKIATLAGVKPPRRIIPLGIARLAAWAQETKYRLLGGALPKISSTAIAVMASGQFLDGGKAHRELGFVPAVDLDETIRRTIDWFKEQGYIKNQPATSTSQAQS